MSVAPTAKVDKRYAELIGEFPLRPIRNDRDFGRAMKIAGRLAVHDEGTLSPGEQDYLDTITVLIEDYDRSHAEEMPSATPLEMLKHFMEEHEMNVSDLGRLIGSQSNASLILSGKREISKRVIQILSKHFKVEPGLFIEVSRSDSPLSPKENARLSKDGKMRVELNDEECYIAATALHVFVIEAESDIAAEPSMEHRHWKLDLIAACRLAMRKIDEEWRSLFHKMNPGPIRGVEKPLEPNRKIVVNLEVREFDALVDTLGVFEDGVGASAAGKVRGLQKKLTVVSKKSKRN